MPCVWPVLPIIVMRLVEQAGQSKGKSIAMGLAFCAGVLLFFACLAGANIILQVFYGMVYQWGDQFRSPGFVAAMALLLVVLALFMFGLFTVSVPSSIAAKSGWRQGFGGAVGMGFLAAILGTPCSFGILAAAFAWAQAQPLGLATLAIMIIGIGMATPYAILTGVPALLKKTPKPGRWMELFKHAIGFVLLVIAVKLIAALPGERRMGVLYFALALSFCVWMWGGWVSYASPASRRWAVRVIAAALAVTAGFALLPGPKPSLVDWQKYDAAVINAATAENKPVLIKFTADWCLSCQVVEKTIYSREDIAELIKQKKVVAIKADTTWKDYPAAISLKELYNEPGVPVSILLVPGQNVPIRWRGLAFGDELKSALEKLQGQ
jgi:thiol:disulfide interchange protein